MTFGRGICDRMGHLQLWANNSRLPFPSELTLPFSPPDVPSLFSIIRLCSNERSCGISKASCCFRMISLEPHLSSCCWVTGDMCTACSKLHSLILESFRYLPRSYYPTIPNPPSSWLYPSYLYQTYPSFPPNSRIQMPSPSLPISYRYRLAPHPQSDRDPLRYLGRAWPFSRS